jgi:Putative beta-barrel porin-2, OmpL-like. bbp2/Carboxypeptidase regulatory-like domain
MNFSKNRSARMFVAILIINGVGYCSAGDDNKADPKAVGGPTAEAGKTVVAGSLRGVTTAAGGFSLAAVDVVIRGLQGSATRHVLSDSEGNFAVKDLPPGSYEITASKEGFSSPAASTVEIAADKTTNSNLQLTEGASGSLRGVTLTTGGFSLGAVQVVVHSVTGGSDRQLTTDSDGAFSIAALPPGKYQITASKAGFASPLGATVEVVQSKTTNASLQLTQPQPTATASAAPLAPPVPAPQPAPAPESPAIGDKPAPQPAETPVDMQTPFADHDWTWLNGNSRQHDSPLDSKYFSGEFRADTFFGLDFNQPVDHSMGGSSEVFRSGEVQLEDLSVGGDFHAGHMRGRLLALFGMFSATTPRNDASPAVGQWDVRSAYRYVSEAYGGYHFDVQHGLNIDAGIFVSYVGLFSYHNYDNWAYQPSYVSSNTPWFFNGLRIQWFPTHHLKIEPWIINGWQSYNKYNGHMGLGGQFKWTAKPWLNIIANQYGYGEDNVGLPHRTRYHTDDSVEVKYYDKGSEANGITRMAFTFTGDMGCETGQGVSCAGNHGVYNPITGKGGPKQSFLGWMAYNRWWWAHDQLAATLGGGWMNNPGRYLTLVLPINGADAISGTPYFPAYPGAPLKAYDGTATLDWMPSQFATFRLEFGYRHTNVPYWSGREGITPPGGNNGLPQYFVCNSGATAGTADLTQAYAACGGPGSVWFPDLRKGQALLSFSIMVKL